MAKSVQIYADVALRRRKPQPQARAIGSDEIDHPHRFGRGKFSGRRPDRLNPATIAGPVNNLKDKQRTTVLVAEYPTTVHRPLKGLGRRRRFVHSLIDLGLRRRGQSDHAQQRQRQAEQSQPPEPAAMASAMATNFTA